MSKKREGDRAEGPLYLKRPVDEPVKGSPPEVKERVSGMLSRIERGGMDAVREYSRELDGWDPPDFRVSEEEVERAADAVEPELREAEHKFGRDNTRRFAGMQRRTLVDFEEEVAPGIVAGQRQVPVGSVGAYQPAGRVPLLASPFMTVAVPKVAGVESVIACVPPSREPGRDGGVHQAMLHSIAVSGADAIYAVGGVQALAAMAFGLFEDLDDPVDMIVGAGNAYVAEAKRQLFGTVGIDLLAGPSEVAVIADDSADPELVAADLLGQAEHGPTSPASLVTTSEELGGAVIEEVEHQLQTLQTAEVAGAAWRDHGTVVVAGSREEAVLLMDEISPEHLEVHTEDDDWYLENLRNYGSLFLGDRSTVAYSDKGMTGTNHVLPTAGAARYTGGLSVAKFTKTLTYQRVTGEEGTRRLAPPVMRFSRTEGLWAHEATARKRFERLGDGGGDLSGGGGEGGMRFRRVIGRNTLLAMGFGSMIGFAWVVLAGGWVVEAGSLGAILAFLVGGLAVGFIGLTYAELMCAMPKVGGEHHYAWRAIGTKGAFVTSWAIALGYISVVMFESVALPTAVGFIAPGYEAGYLWTIAGYEVRLTWVLVGVVSAVAVTALNYVGIRPAAIFQLIAALFMVGVGVLLLFGTVTNGSVQNFSPLIAGGAAGVLAVVIQTPFLFVGFDVIPQSAEEIDLPVRKIGVYLLVSIAMATAWYVLIVVGVSSSLGQGALGSSESPTADALGALFGGGFFADVIILGGVAGILTSWNALLVGGSRILYAMAEHGMLPAWLGRLHPRYRTPSNAVLLIGALSVISPWFGESMLVWLVNAGSLNIVVAYVLVAASFLLLRRNEPGMPRPFRAGGGPYVGAIALVLGLGIGVQYLPGMPAGLSWPAEWLIVLLWWAAGLLFMARMDAPEYSPEVAGE